MTVLYYTVTSVNVIIKLFASWSFIKGDICILKVDLKRQE